MSDCQRQFITHNYEPVHDKTNKMMCAQQILRSTWASAQSDQSFLYPREESLGPCLPFERTAKALIRLGSCPDWSESSLGAQVILLVLSCCGSYMSHVTTRPAFGVCDQLRLKPACSATEIRAWVLKFCTIQTANNKRGDHTVGMCMLILCLKLALARH